MQRGSGHLVASGGPGHCRAGAQRSARGSKPEREGVSVRQHFSCARSGQATVGRPRSEPDWGKPTVRKCVQKRLTSSVGVSPTWAKARRPVAWMAGQRETNGLKPIGTTICRMVRESSGRNAYERQGGLVRWQVWRSSPLPEGEDSMANRRLAETIGHSSGVRATAR